MPPFIIDAHQDLAYNILNFNRDYCLSAEEIRKQETESGSEAPTHTGEALLGWPDYQRGRVALVFSTLFITPMRHRLGEWDRQVYATYDQAYALYGTQLDAYHRLADDHPAKFRLVGNRKDLEEVVAPWRDGIPGDHPVGLVPLMEGAEAVRSPDELEEWWQRGVRIIGPAWGATRFCGGTREPGPLTEDGRWLLEGMAEAGFALDLSHMDELAARQALDMYEGSIIASHSNALSLLPDFASNRMLPENDNRGILEREGVIGVVPYCRFLEAGWKKGDPRNGITLETLAAHIDHICQLAGDALHVGLGTDFDGGFGLESVPQGVDTIADLQALGPVLAAKGYNNEQVAAVLGTNWLRLLQSILP
jgi:membrane dipeptidase